MNRRTSLKVVGSAALIGTAARRSGGSTRVDILKSADVLATDTAEVIYGRHKVDGTWGLIRHDVVVYRIEYTTRDIDGKEITASGAILMPKGLKRPRFLCYGRGTIIPGSGERNAPS